MSRPRSIFPETLNASTVNETQSNKNEKKKKRPSPHIESMKKSEKNYWYYQQNMHQHWELPWTLKNFCWSFLPPHRANIQFQMTSQEREVQIQRKQNIIVQPCVVLVYPLKTSVSFCWWRSRTDWNDEIIYWCTYSRMDDHLDYHKKGNKYRIFFNCSEIFSLDEFQSDCNE